MCMCSYSFTQRYLNVSWKCFINFIQIPLDTFILPYWIALISQLLLFFLNKSLVFEICLIITNPIRYLHPAILDCFDLTNFYYFFLNKSLVFEICLIIRGTFNRNSVYTILIDWIQYCACGLYTSAVVVIVVILWLYIDDIFIWHCPIWHPAYYMNHI